MKLLTVSEVASILRVNYYTVLRMIHRGDIIASKIDDKSFRIKEEDVEKLFSTK